MTDDEMKDMTLRGIKVLPEPDSSADRDRRCMLARFFASRSKST